MKTQYSLLVLILLFSACSNQVKSNYDGVSSDYSDCDYYNCDSEEPFSTQIYVKFTRNSENPNPVIYLKNGYYDSGEVVDTFKTISIAGNVANFNVSLNQQYTVYTDYKLGDKNITAIDGKLVMKKSRVECDSTCWSITNTVFNIKLKY